MNTSEWFSYQLKASEEGFVWAVEQVPVERQTSTPPKGFGEWNVARHIFHMLHYERTLALPHMRYWRGGPSAPLPSFDEHSEEETWEREGQSTSIERLLQEFQQVRAAQIALLPSFDETLWNEVRASVWGEKSIRWIVSKTFQIRQIIQMQYYAWRCSGKMISHKFRKQQKWWGIIDGSTIDTTSPTRQRGQA